MKKWQLIDSNNKVDSDAFHWANKILKDKIIVIADDHYSTLTWLKLSLEDYGAKVFVFEHGKEAIDFIKELKNNSQMANILILDLIMNEIGGLEIARDCIDDAKGTILFLTGCSSTSQEVASAQKLGRVIQKPVGLEALIKHIMTALCPDWEETYLHNDNATT